MTARPSQLSEEDVLLAFAAEAQHDRATLEAYVSQHPEHAEALAELAAELTQFPHRQQTQVSINDPAVDKAWDAFRAASTTTAAVSARIARLATLDSTSFREVARKLDITSLLLSRIRDRTIDLATIPAKLLERVAHLLGMQVEALREELAQPSQIAPSEAFKASDKPKPPAKISFEEALQSSGLSDKQKHALRDLME